MTDKEAIRKEIERQKKHLSANYLDENGAMIAYNHIIDFIDSLPEEPVSENRKESILKKAHELANRAELISDKFPKSTLIAVAIDMAEWCYSHSTKEPVSEELEKAAHTYAANNGGRWLTDDIGIKCFAFNPKEVKDAFKAGTQWQKEKMMKDASDMIKGVENTISYTTAQALSSDLNKIRIEYGNNVK